MDDDAESTPVTHTDGDELGDGVPDYLEIDSDNDGIFDVVEGGDGDLDTNNDGVIDANDIGYTDNDGDGMDDDSENTPQPDTDGDGNPDYLDIDSDNDGIFDVDEGGDGDLDTNNDGVIDSKDTGYTDNDGDGMDDDSESTPVTHTDGDEFGDGVPDYLDIDSDNDGIHDVEEGGDGDLDTNNDGVIDEIGNSNFKNTENCDVIIDADGATITPGFIDSHVHITFGDYTPRQNTIGYLSSYLHGGTTTSITASEVHVPGRPNDPEGVKALAIAAKKCFDNYTPGGMPVYAGSVI